MTDISDYSVEHVAYAFANQGRIQKMNYGREGVGTGEGLCPSPVEVWGLCPKAPRIFFKRLCLRCNFSILSCHCQLFRRDKYTVAGILTAQETPLSISVYFCIVSLTEGDFSVVKRHS